MRRRRVSTLLACLPLTGLAVAAQTTEPTPAAKEYVIQSGDLMRVEDFFRGGGEIWFWGQIRDDGKTTLPLCGDIVAAGKTIPQVNSDIRTALSKYLSSVPANASVVVKDNNGILHGTPSRALTVFALETPTRASSEVNEKYVIQKGDLIRFPDFFRDPASFVFRTQIREDGKITLPKYGDILAAGKTIRQLNSEIRALVSEDIKLPNDDWSAEVTDKKGTIHSALPHAIY